MRGTLCAGHWMLDGPTGHGQHGRCFRAGEQCEGRGQVGPGGCEVNPKPPVKGYKEGPLERTLNLIPLYNPIYTLYSPYIHK